ncbi:MAG: hypothetical protein AVDCRST_MAG88-1304, partial [uncultured Thermomicrobiales bacterium]
DDQPESFESRPGGGTRPDRHLDQPGAQPGDPDALQERGARLRPRRHGARVALDRDGRRHGAPRPRAWPAAGRAPAGAEPRVDHAAARHRRLGAAPAAGRYAGDRPGRRRRRPLRPAGEARDVRCGAAHRFRQRRQPARAAGRQQRAGPPHDHAGIGRSLPPPGRDRGHAGGRCRHARPRGPGPGPRRPRHARPGARDRRASRAPARGGPAPRQGCGDALPDPRRGRALDQRRREADRLQLRRGRAAPGLRGGDRAVARNRV